NMKAVVDLFITDQFDNEVDINMVRLAIEKFKFRIENVDYDALENAIKQVQLDHQPMKGYILSQGTMPDIGESAEIEFSFSQEQVDSQMNKLMGATKVFKDDLLCSISSPTKGEFPGKDIFNKVIPPLLGTSVELKTGKGVVQSLDQSCISECDGIVKVKKEWVQRNDVMGFERKVFHVEIDVEPIRIVKGSEIDSLTTTDHVEIQGPLKAGAKIMTSGSIFVDGAVNDGANIRSMKELVVTGEVFNSDLNADGSITVDNNVAGSTVRSNEDIDIKGLAANSTVSGRDIKIDEVLNSTIEAEEGVTINRVSGLETGDPSKRTRIRVGVADFMQNKIDSDKELIESSRESLKRLTGLLGEKLAADIGVKPVQTILIKFVSQEKKKGHPPYSQEQLQSIRTLIESIEPLMMLIQEKNESLDVQREKMKNIDKSKGVVLIKEKVTVPIDIEIGGEKTTIEDRAGPMNIKLKFSEEKDAMVADVSDAEDTPVAPSIQTEQKPEPMESAAPPGEDDKSTTMDFIFE
ncbi:MAG: FapA family protein, partial [Candidatus Electryonea clarkiae]|nr:FapA family protein [Candidatus Electryonea clarkiae]